MIKKHSNFAFTFPYLLLPQYQEAIARALAHEYKASYLSLDPWDFAVQRAPESPEGGLKRAGRSARMGGRLVCVVVHE